jgi:hypothetical protein
MEHHVVHPRHAEALHHLRVPQGRRAAGGAACALFAQQATACWAAKGLVATLSRVWSLVHPIA